MTSDPTSHPASHPASDPASAPRPDLASGQGADPDRRSAATALLVPLLLAGALLAAGAADAPARGQEAAEAPTPAESPAQGREATDGHAEKAPAIVIHGGAGSIREIDMSDDEEAAYRAEMREALRAGHELLEEGGTAVDACVAAIQVMERSPMFNSGVGAVFTSEGTVEHDASIMRGSTRNSGAVAGTRHLFSPIAAARLVMDSSRHVMLAREGAEVFAEQHGFEMVPNDTFYSQERLRQWRERHGQAGDGEAEGDDGGPRASVGSGTVDGSGAAERDDGADRSGAAHATGIEEAPVPEEAHGAAHASGPAADHLGTVGCAARDRSGDLAAGTSTGGTSNKRWGRIGDSPIIGAGTYADNETAAISATGYGEFFIRGVVAHDIASMMRYTGLELAPAVNAVVHGRLEELGPEATGGVIAMDGDGKIAVAFNTPGMFRGWIGTDGETTIEFYR